MTSEEREQLALAQTLAWAQEAADGGDVGEALDWLHVVEQLHGPLSPVWQQTRADWTRQQGRQAAV